MSALTPGGGTTLQRTGHRAGHQQGHKASLGTEWLDRGPRSPDSGPLTAPLTELQERGARTAVTCEVGTIRAPLRTAAQDESVSIQLLARAWHVGLSMSSAGSLGSKSRALASRGGVSPLWWLSSAWLQASHGGPGLWSRAGGDAGVSKGTCRVLGCPSTERRAGLRQHSASSCQSVAKWGPLSAHLLSS